MLAALFSLARAPIIVVILYALYATSVAAALVTATSANKNTRPGSRFGTSTNSNPARSPDTCQRPCGARGRCVRSACVCSVGYAGLACETVLRPVTGRVFPVPPAGALFYHFQVSVRGEVAVHLRLAGERSGTRTRAQAAYASLLPYPLLIVSRVGFNSPPPPLPPRPPEGDEFRAHWRRDRRAVLHRMRLQQILYTNAQPKDTLYIAIYPQKSWWSQTVHEKPVQVQLRVVQCARKGDRECRIRKPPEVTAFVTVLTLPILLSTLALLTILACIRAWSRVVRRVWNTPTTGGIGVVGAHDRLTQTECDAMFPRFTYVKSQAAALDAMGETSCAVCLNTYLDGHSLRRLRCGHSYHAQCVDAWLETNATCPRCRKPARIRVSYTSRILAFRSAIARAIRTRVIPVREPNLNDSRPSTPSASAASSGGASASGASASVGASLGV